MKFKLTILFFLSVFFSFSQRKVQHNKHKPFFISKSKLVSVVPPLAGRELEAPTSKESKEDYNNIWLNYPTNFNALPKGVDPLVKKNRPQNYHYYPGNPVMESFDGASETANAGAGVPDPTGAVGPNHYIHAYNSGFVIFDKLGNVLVPHAALGTLFDGVNDGDPIVFYDRYADRFVITEFNVGVNAQGPYSILMAICEGSDPVNDGWKVYEFPVDDMPDYPKFAIWHNGYYLTANKQMGNNVYVINRDEMIAGNNNARIVGFDLPNVNQNPNAVFAPMAMNSIGPNLPDANTPGHIVYLEDDAWDNVAQDQLKFWDITVDWNNTLNSAVSNPVTINTTPFDSFVAAFGSGEVPQPNTNQKIDGITGLLSFACNYYAYDDHNAITLNFNVDVNGDNGKLGIRWYELNENNGNINIVQEGTFAPNDDIYRFMGSMAIDSQGNIGLAYERGNAQNHVSIYFTGRRVNDPLNQMTIDEELIVQGLGSNMIHNRFGDYAHLTLDPVDNKTFWYVGEYFDANNAWRTRISSFKIAENANNDVGVTAIVAPVDSSLTNDEQVTVTIRNFGLVAQSNIPVSYSVDNVVVANEVYTGTINPSQAVDYTFTTHTNLSTLGQTYAISATTSLAGDEDVNNDVYSKDVKNLEPNDIGVTGLDAPASGTNLTNAEHLTVNINNFGGVAQSNFDVTYTINNGAPVTEQVAGPIAFNSSLQYTFNQVEDFSEFGDYDITITTSLNNDSDTSNDSFNTIVTHSICQPSSDCSFGDGLVVFQIGTIDNNSGCEGYGDFTDLSTDLVVDSTNSLTVQSEFDSQHLKVWIDFNDDFVFEANELVVNEFVFGDAAATSTDVVIPANTALGSHLMRAKTNWDDVVPADACEEIQYGETEDYMVNIVSVAGTEDAYFNNLKMTVKNVENNIFEVTLPASELDETMVITLHNVLGQKFVKNRVYNKGGNYKYTLNLNGLASGVYLIRLGTNTFGRVKRIIVK